jgi:heat shock protein 1/8
MGKKNRGKQEKQQDKNKQQSEASTASAVPVFHNAIAIDFGDDSCSVGYFSHKENKIVIIQNEDGDFTTPSVLSFTAEEILIGKPALQNQPRNAKNTIYNIKSLLQTPKDTHTTYPFSIAQDGTGVSVEYMGQKKTYSMQDLIGMVIGKMKSVAEHYLSKTVVRCVVTIPRHFNETQREIVANACKDLGLEVLQLLDDPIAAAICYELDTLPNKENEKQDFTSLVVDIGRHSSRAAIVRTHRPTGLLEVVSHDITTDCGGDLIDECMVSHLLQDIKQRHFSSSADQFRESVTSSARVMARLRQECERAKQALSQTTSASIELDSLYDGVDYSTQITRARFDMLCTQPLQALMELVKKQISASSPTQVDRVLVVGASARIPKIQEMIKSLNVPETNCDSLVDEPVMSGAARQAYLLRTRIDHLKANKEEQDDQADRIRASEQVPVTPLSIGIEVNGGLRTVVVPRNTSLPYSNTIRVSNANNNSSALLLRVVQGERPFAGDNDPLPGSFAVLLNGAGDRGTTQVDLTFSVDVAGKLKVNAKDAASGESLKIAPAKANANHAQGEAPTVEDLLAAAIDNAQADQEKLTNAESRLKLEAYVYKMKTKHVDNQDAQRLSDETLEWINTNDDKTHNEYLLKLRQYHSALPK